MHWLLPCQILAVRLTEHPFYVGCHQTQLTSSYFTHVHAEFGRRPPYLTGTASFPLLKLARQTSLCVLCPAGPQLFQRPAIIMKLGVMCKSSVILLVVSGKKPSRETPPHHTQFASSSGVNSHMGILLLVSKKWRIEVRNYSSSDPYPQNIKIKRPQNLLSCLSTEVCSELHSPSLSTLF